jgi:hypothetical protein
MLYSHDEYSLHIHYSGYDKALQERTRLQEALLEKNDEKVVFVGDDRIYTDIIPDQEPINPMSGLVFS